MDCIFFYYTIAHHVFFNTAEMRAGVHRKRCSCSAKTHGMSFAEEGKMEEVVHDAHFRKQSFVDKVRTKSNYCWLFFAVDFSSALLFWYQRKQALMKEVHVWMLHRKQTSKNLAFLQQFAENVTKIQHTTTTTKLTDWSVNNGNGCQIHAVQKIIEFLNTVQELPVQNIAHLDFRSLQCKQWLKYCMHTGEQTMEHTQAQALILFMQSAEVQSAADEADSCSRPKSILRTVEPSLRFWCSKV